MTGRDSSWERTSCTVSHIMVTSPLISWLFFKARAKRPYLNYTGRASNAEKQPTGRGPEGCVEMGRRLRCSSVTYRLRYAPSSRLAGGHFERNDVIIICETVH